MRLFVTVGNAFQPFDRLVAMVDEAIEKSGVPCEGVFQLGFCTAQPKRLEAVKNLSKADFARECERADVFVGHAGVGTLFSALEHGHQPIVVPRRGTLGEHVNDHQLEIAEALASAGKIVVVEDAEKLAELLRAYASGARHKQPPSSKATSPALELVRASLALGRRSAPGALKLLGLRALAAFAPPLEKLRVDPSNWKGGPRAKDEAGT